MLTMRKKWKTGGSNVEQCPALYDVMSGEGGYVVQGKRRGDGVVWVNFDVLDRLHLDLSGVRVITRVDDGYLVRGPEISPGERVTLDDLADDETGVRLPASELGLIPVS